ncbi:RNA-binding protein 41 isoform X2 [Electrophorus electricus]|nr:RNA-binding protein 41 isoform X2 [Electrophorus electricus]XP_026874007.2 RNA-binding protein 41 isoform X2 [Electrophorus electricus]
MKRVARHVCDDGPIPEEQETEGQRQLHSLLLQQLHTDVNIDRCVAKKKCFAPATLYKPFGKQAAGVRSLAQFQALQDGEQELASLRELGLTDTEIELWRSRDQSKSGERSRGVSAAPDARDERLQVIRDKMAARAELLTRPQRFSASRALSRREMEIERALFHGNDRCSFLTALYHQEEDSQNDQQGATSCKPVDTLYRDFLKDQQKDLVVSAEPVPSIRPDFSHTDISHKQSTLKGTDPDQSCAFEDCTTTSSSSHELQTAINMNTQTHSLNQGKCSRLAISQKIAVNQPIGHLTAFSGQGQDSPMTVSGRIEEISNEEIANNRETEEGIRRISRFRNYQRGEPSSVLCVKNMSLRASLAQLVSLFSRFQKGEAKPILYRLLTGRLKGQAFITFSDIETAQAALEMLNGYRLLDKPLVIEFGRERKDPNSGNCCRNTSITTVQGSVELCKD